MSARSVYLDEGVGERRGVVMLDGRPERLMIVRAGEASVQRLGACVVARVRSVDRSLSLAFLDLGQEPDAVLNLSSEIGPLTQGSWVQIQIRAEARTGKGASVRWLGPAEGPARLLSAGPGLEEQLIGVAKGATLQTGTAARTAADRAQEEALETVFALPGGGSIAVEATRALTAVDIDLGGRPGQGGKHTARLANIAAIGEAGRVLRLKGLGGLVVIDLAGRGHDGAVLLAAARAAFAPDNPGVAMGPVSRFGTLELTIPRRMRPAVDILTKADGAPSDLTMAMALLRDLEREASGDGGGRFEGLAAPGIAIAAQPFLCQLTDRFGARLSVSADPAQSGYEVRRL